MKKLFCLLVVLLLLAGCAAGRQDGGEDGGSAYKGRFLDSVNAPLGTLNMYTTADTVSINTSRLCTLKL